MSAPLQVSHRLSSCRLALAPSGKLVSKSLLVTSGPPSCLSSCFPSCLPSLPCCWMFLLPPVLSPKAAAKGLSHGTAAKFNFSLHPHAIDYPHLRHPLHHVHRLHFISIAYIISIINALTLYKENVILQHLHQPHHLHRLRVIPAINF